MPSGVLAQARFRDDQHCSPSNLDVTVLVISGQRDPNPVIGLNNVES
jgi:hypothetical protein